MCAGKSISSSTVGNCNSPAGRVFLVTQGEGWAGRQEGKRKEKVPVCPRNRVTPPSIPVCTGVSQESHARLQQPLCCCSLVPAGETEAGSRGAVGPKWCRGGFGVQELACNPQGHLNV